MFDLRIGHGYDAHRFASDRKLVLCGVEIPSEEGLLGHSDADAPTHALIDALLGAMALGDIGALFPDGDPAYKDISSLILLEKTVGIMRENGYSLVNADITIIAEKPRLARYIPDMRAALANAFGVSVTRISVKATTEEGLGLAGKGVGAHCVLLLSRGKTAEV